ncbi:MAG: hypothetical protein H6737_06255 [Alphaproteobacteria bacterium]|nr:hypothetical protein [Alphaproteobacteria bacterium]
MAFDDVPAGWTAHGGEVRGAFTEAHVGCFAWSLRLLVTPLVVALCALVIVLGVLAGDVPDGDPGDLIAWAWSPGKRPLKVRLTQHVLQIGHQQMQLRHIRDIQVTPTALVIRTRFRRRWALSDSTDHLELEWLAAQVKRVQDPQAPGREVVPTGLHALGRDREG